MMLMSIFYNSWRINFDDIDLSNLSAIDDVMFIFYKSWRKTFDDIDLSNLSAR